jgi:hypothetical protein
MNIYTINTNKNLEGNNFLFHSMALDMQKILTTIRNRSLVATSINTWLPDANTIRSTMVYS